jgi:hypothetical protein
MSIFYSVGNVTYFPNANVVPESDTYRYNPGSVDLGLSQAGTSYLIIPYFIEPNQPSPVIVIWNASGPTVYSTSGCESFSPATATPEW